MALCCSPKEGRTSRKRHTPLWSVGSCDERRSRHRALSVAASRGGFAPGWGKTTSSKSPHVAQGKPDSATGVTAPQPMQRNSVSSSLGWGATGLLICVFRKDNRHIFRDEFHLMGFGAGEQ